MTKIAFMNQAAIVDGHNQSAATFGCGPCIGVGIVNPESKVALIGHFSTPEIALLLNQVMYRYKKRVRENSENELHLGGGYMGQSEDIRKAVLTIIPNHRDLNFRVVSDKSCIKKEGSDSLEVFTDGTVREYHVTGKEKLDMIDMLQGVWGAYLPSLKLYVPGENTPLMLRKSVFERLVFQRPVFERPVFERPKPFQSKSAWRSQHQRRSRHMTKRQWYG